MRIIRDCFAFIAGVMFGLFAAPIIHLSGLDKEDDFPTEEESEKLRALAEKCKKIK